MSAEESEFFVESDTAETSMTFGEGRVPFYIALIWIVSMISFASFIFVYALPDLVSWFGG